MLTRRQFIPLASSAALAVSGTRLLSQAGKPIKLSGDFDFHYEKGHLKMRATDVTVGGINLPSATWGWIGVAAAQGVLNGVGSLVFGAIVDALRGKQTSIEELLARQLEQIAHIIQDALTEQDLKKCQQLIRAYARRYKEYTNQQTPSILQEVLGDTNKTLEALADHHFYGYQSYMVCAALRMTALQEVVRLGNKGGKKDLEDVYADTLKFHQGIEEVIDHETSLATLAERFQFIYSISSATAKFRDNGGIRALPISGAILGKRLPDRAIVFTWKKDGTDLSADDAQELIRSSNEFQTKVLSQGPVLGGAHPVRLSDLRATLKAENTDIGMRILNIQHPKVNCPGGLFCDDGLIHPIDLSKKYPGGP